MFFLSKGNLLDFHFTLNETPFSKGGKSIVKELPPSKCITYVMYVLMHYILLRLQYSQ